MINVAQNTTDMTKDIILLVTYHDPVIVKEITHTCIGLDQKRTTVTYSASTVGSMATRVVYVPDK